MDSSELVDTSKVDNLVNLIDTYGPVVTVLGVFLFVFMVVILLILKSFMDSQKKMQQDNTEILHAILSNYEGKKVAELDTIKEADPKAPIYNPTHLVDIFVKLDKLFKFDCKSFAKLIKSERVGIYVFHNGTHSSHGLPFFKLSCICEYVERDSGIKNHMQDSVNIPLSVYGELIETIYDYGHAIIKKDPNNGDEILSTISSVLTNDSTISILKKDKISTALFVAVYDSFEHVLAFIMAEFIDNISQEQIESSLNELKFFCARVRPALEFSGYNEEKGDK